MSADDTEPSLFELFRDEVRAHTGALDAGLLAVECAPAEAATLAQLVRAAHSIRGAARIVGMPQTERLTRALEDLFTAAEQGDAPLAQRAAPIARRAARLLAGVLTVEESDLLAWENDQIEEIDELTAQLRSVREGRQERQGREGPPLASPTRAAPPGPSASQNPLADKSMLELFRMEVESQTAVLNEELVALEADPTHLERLELILRAAHSVKGAARIVGLDAAVGISHLVEDYLVAARDGQLTIGSDAIDVLLRGTDLLAQLAAATAIDLDGWLRARAAELAELMASLRELVAGGAAEAREVRSLAARPESQGAPVATISPQASGPSPPVVRPPASERRKLDRTGVAAPNGTAVATAAPADKSGLTPGERDRVVRVSAGNIDRLMGLAGESLVEARRLQPFADSLHKLLTRQSNLGDLLEQLHEVIASASDDLTRLAEASELVLAAKARALDCRSLVVDRMAEFEGYVRRSEDLTRRLYRETISSRMRPFSDGVRGFSRMVRDLGRTLGKNVDLLLIGGDAGVDRDILEKIEAPLNHLARNAVDHGIETPAERAAAGKPERATIRLEARHWAGMLSITVSDDGRGIDEERVRWKLVERGLATPVEAAELRDSALFDYLFLPGFSTASEVTEISGRGVGLDVVQSVIQEVGGSVRISSERGRGTSFHLQLPITLSVVRAVVVEIAQEAYAFPLMRIDRIVALPASQVHVLEGRQYFSLEGKNIGLVHGAQVLELDGAPPEGAELHIVVVSDRTHTCGIVVDRFLGEHDLVVRPLDRRLGKVADISAAAILGDGSPLLIVDVDDLLRSVVRLVATTHSGQFRRLGSQPAAQKTRKQVLVVDDSITVREVERQLLENRGYQVTIAVDGMDGWQTVRNQSFDLVITDVDMPRLNGIDLVRSIKQDARLKALPVMIVSYRDREEDRVRGLEAGANYYLTKSNFHDETLVQAVVDLIGEPA